jgi:iron-sulfur cluster insertion protein
VSAVIEGPATVAPAPLQVSDAAVRKIGELIAEEGNPLLKLRIYVTGGGCSGFQYGFAFEENAADDDLAIEKSGVTLIVDPMSLMYLGGADIDYEDALEGARFVIRNPNAQSTCGCGSSFSV